MPAGKKRCRTMSLTLMAVIHPWNNVVYLNTNLVTSHPQAISAQEWAYFMLTHPLVSKMVKHKTVFVSLALGSSICSAQVGLFRKRMAEQCALGNDGTKAGFMLCFFFSSLRAINHFFLVVFLPFFFSFCALLLATVVSRESLVFFFCCCFVFLKQPHRQSQLHAEMQNWKFLSVWQFSGVLRASFEEWRQDEREVSGWSL